MSTQTQRPCHDYPCSYAFHFIKFHFIHPVFESPLSQTMLEPVARLMRESSLQLGISKRSFIGRRVSRQTKIFISPCAEVVVFAAFTAKRPKWVGL